jgi:hypothetical protein
MNKTSASVNPLVGSLLVIRDTIQNYIVRFKYTLVVSLVLMIALDMRCESEKFSRFVPKF